MTKANYKLPSSFKCPYCNGKISLKPIRSLFTQFAGAHSGKKPSLIGNTNWKGRKTLEEKYKEQYDKYNQHRHDRVDGNNE